MPPVDPLWAFVIVTLILSAGQTLFAAMLLLLAKNHTNNENYFLVVFLIVLCAAIILFFLFDFWVLYLPHVILSYQPLVFLLPPLLWCYVHRLVSPSEKLAVPVVMLHCLPVIIILALLTPFYTLPGIEKIEWLYRIRGWGVSLDNIQSFTMAIIPYIKYASLIQGVAYSVVILKMIRHHKILIKNQFSNIDRIQLNWLVYLVWSCLFIYALALFSLFVFCCDKYQWVWAINVISGAVLLIVFGFFGVVQKTVYESGRYMSSPILDRGGDGQDAVDMDSLLPKYVSSALSDEHVKELYDSLLGYMNNIKPFLDSNLMLIDLAEAMQLPAREMSRVINQMAEVNFLDFVNDYRLREAKKMLRENQSMNVLDIAMSCGFNSKSAFYQAFKKSTNMTPTVYRTKAIADLH